MNHIARRTAAVTAAIAAVALVSVGCSDNSSTPSIGNLTGSVKAAAGSMTAAAGSMTASVKSQVNGAMGGATETNIATPTGNIAVSGPVLAKYTESGGQNGTLGLPTKAQETAKDGGVYQDFAGGTIYYNDKTQAHIVWGEIRKAWEADGGADGSLGYPVTDEHPIPTGLQSDFQNGNITFVNGQTAIVPK